MKIVMENIQLGTDHWLKLIHFREKKMLRMIVKIKNFGTFCKIIRIIKKLQMSNAKILQT